MPHKHTRKGGEVSSFDLPPSSFARSLPVGKATAAKGKKSKPRNGKTQSLKSQEAGRQSDTPKAFTRLMRFHSTGKHPPALDHGDPQSKKRKRDTQEPRLESQAHPTIQPGERLADFSARVDQSLPIAGLNKRGKKQPGVPSERQTKMEKKLQRLQSHLRDEVTKRKEAEKEAMELQEDEEAERDYWRDEKSGQNKKRKRGTKRDPDGDPWAVLNQTREQPKGLHDVVQAPPDFKRIPAEKFKVKNGAIVDVANVPGSAGSLRRREELGSARRSVISSYRKLMDERRNRNST